MTFLLILTCISRSNPYLDNHKLHPNRRGSVLPKVKTWLAIGACWGMSGARSGWVDARCRAHGKLWEWSLSMQTCHEILNSWHPFVSPLTFQPTYISLIYHVCFCSLYIDFDSFSSACVQLKYSILLASPFRNYPWLLNLCLLTLSIHRNYFCSTSWLSGIWKPPRSTLYLLVLKIPGLQQKAGTVHELKPLSRPPIASGNLQDPIYMLASLGLTHNIKTARSSPSYAKTRWWFQIQWVCMVLI